MRLVWLRAVAILATVALPCVAHAQEWKPERAITLVVPSAPGNASDAVARILGDKMSAALGQPIIIENRVGASGNLGTGAVAKAQPDGYTLGLPASGPLAVNKTLFSKLPYDPERDFEMISLVATLPNVIVTSPKLPVKTLDEFIAYVKEHPGKVNYASIGNGTSQHLAAALFEKVTGTRMQHVPYRAANQLVVDLLSGDIQVSFQLIPNVAAQLQTGDLKPIAVTASRRSLSLPNVPTTAELGLKGYEAYGWFALVAPKGTPKPIVDRLQKEVQAAIADPALRAKFVELGADPVSSTPEELRAFVRDEIQKWGDLIKSTGIAIE